MDNCSICGQPLITALDLGQHPLCDDLQSNVDSSLKVKTYPINIKHCPCCLTSYNTTYIHPNLLFPPNYHYRSCLTQDVLIGLDNFSSELSKLPYCTDTPILLDVGCNDGSLLDLARQKGFHTFGIEPTDAAVDARTKGHNILNQFFNVATAKEFLDRFGSPDVISFTNVFAHIDPFEELCQALSLLISDHTILAIENHYLLSVLLLHQFDTYYHEHPRTYSLHSFVYIAKRLGLNIFSVSYPGRYGGNIRVFMSRRFPETILELHKESHINQLVLQQQDVVSKWIAKKQSDIETLVSTHGPLPSKAFPGRAAILYTLLGLTTRQISSVFERQLSPKLNFFVPGSDIKIISDDLLGSISPSIPIINNAWHISSEIRSYIRTLGLTNTVIDIISPSDF